VALASVPHRRTLGYVLAGCAVLLVLLLLPLRIALHETSKIGPPVFYCYGALLLTLAAANFALALSEFVRTSSTMRLAWCGSAAVIVLLPVLFADRLAKGIIGWDVSGRTIANEVQVRSIPLDTLSVRSMNRGQLYSLSFYVRREIPTVQQGELKEGRMLLRSSMCERLGDNQWETHEVPFDAQKTGWFLCEVKRRASAGATSSSGQPR
jgi:hypothetical protein